MKSESVFKFIFLVLALIFIVWVAASFLGLNPDNKSVIDILIRFWNMERNQLLLTIGGLVFCFFAAKSIIGNFKK